jgi:hypothetical protein
MIDIFFFLLSLRVKNKSIFPVSMEVISSNKVA